MLLLINFIFILPFISSKIYEGYVIVPMMHQQNNWFYLGRQTLSPGTSVISLQTNIKGIPFSQFQSIQFAIINQTEWNVNDVLKCQSKASKSVNHILKMNGEVNKANVTIQESEPSLYYFVFRDCANLLHGQRQNYQLQLFYTLTVLNNDSHLGHYQNCFFIIMMLVSTLMLSYKVVKDGQKTQQKDWIQIGLFIGLLSQAAALFSKIVSFAIAWKFGFRLNLIIFNIVYSVFGSFGDSLIATILLFISFGWTIIFINLDQYEIYIPPIAVFSFAHILLSILGVVNQSLHSKYHIYDSIPGVILIFVKIIAVIIFIFGIYRSNKKGGNPMQQKFMIGFGIVGATYILIVPLTYLICQLGISEGKQQHYAIIIKQTLSIAFNILFVYNLVDSNSVYRLNRKRHTFLPVDQKFY